MKDEGYKPNFKIPFSKMSKYVILHGQLLFFIYFTFCSLIWSSFQLLKCVFLFCFIYSLTTTNGVAIAGNDYTSVSEVVTFNPSANAIQTINVPVSILNDIFIESSETFTASLSKGTTNPDLLTIGSPSSTTVTITDNDSKIYNLKIYIYIYIYILIYYILIIYIYILSII